MADLATALLPVLHRPLAARFNVFDVMRHSTGEKQISKRVPVAAGRCSSGRWGLVVGVEGSAAGGETLQLRIGPSAWYANTQDARWTRRVDPDAADYARLFLTRVQARQIHPSAVTLQIVLGGLAPTNRALHEEFVALLRGG